VSDGCFVCEKHHEMDAVPGGVLLADEHMIVSHLPLVTPAGTEERVYLGRLLVEPRRHVEGLDELTGDEASSLGRFVAEASRALKVGGGAEHVYAAVISDLVKHTHLHLLPRYPGTPREYYWTRLDEWPQAPTGDAAAVDAFVERLREAVG
jgi:diadenosine tetraphosphate (Ap4A) HIT family hydrolase